MTEPTGIADPTTGPVRSEAGPRLQRGCWSSAEVGGLAQVLERARAGGDGWQGIAYTTAGAQALQSVTDGVLRSTNGQAVPEERVYELRLWRVDRALSEEGLLARELRWVNGSGSAEITVRGSTDSDEGANGAAGPVRDAAGREPAETVEQHCWYRHNAYLQHGARPPFNRREDTMTSIEVFIDVDYGNTVFADELMTGRWV